MSDHDPLFFSDFHVHHVNYKHIGGHPVPLSIMVPKKIVGSQEDRGVRRPTSTPWIAQFHGGFLVSGARGYSGWFPKWLVEFTLANDAIMVAPDYRLLPESNGNDILTDLDDFWGWVRESLNKELESRFPGTGIWVNSERVLVTGQSAGGYLVAQSFLRHPDFDMRAAILTYPMVHLRDRFWSEKYTKSMFGSPDLPLSILEDHIKTTPPGTIITTDGDPEKGEPMTRSPLALCMVQNGKFLDILGHDSTLFPVEVASHASKLPPYIWIFHGRQDTAVPVEGATVFAEVLKSKFPDTEVRLDLHDGEHGYDTPLHMDDEHIQPGLKEVKKYWP